MYCEDNGRPSTGFVALFKAKNPGKNRIADPITQKKKEQANPYSTGFGDIAASCSQHEGGLPFLNQFCEGDNNKPQYRERMAEMYVNKFHFYGDKMPNTQGGHFDVDLKDMRSLKGQLANNPNCDTNDLPFWVRGFALCQEAQKINEKDTF